MDELLVSLYNRHVGTAFDRQQRFAAFSEKKSPTGEFGYDRAAAALFFGRAQLEAPVLGSHAHGNNSWLWAWSDKHLKLSLTNRALGDTVRATWHRLGVHPLGAPGFALEPLLGAELTEVAAHVLGVILSRELEYDAFFTIPGEGTTDLLLLRDERLKFTEKRPLVRIATQFPELLRSMPVPDHKAALAAYARDYSLTVTESPHELKITAGGKDELTATFDEHGRLAKLEGVALPAPKPPVRKPTTKKKPAAKKAAAKKPATKPAGKAAAKKTPAKKAVKPAVKKAAAKPPAKKPTPKKK